MAPKDFRNLLCYGQKMKQCYDYSNTVFHMQRDILFPQVFSEVSAIINKLKKLRVKYKTEKGKLKKSGTSRPKKGWKFFEKMDAIYKENPSIQPPYVIDSSKKSGESDLSDEETTSFEGSGEKFALPC